ncbi:MAG TPA: 4-alpha-glucanotransferase, partial [Chitinispirillaceae bacterium]|nr:4-alpha-glucanotransferase [Chitinispirillaceae bacterium]
WKRLQRYCADRNISIIGDMPIYVALDSTETWTNPELFKLDKNKQPLAVSGVPPDFFSATGQLWNNPVYNWDEHKRTGFTWWIKRMRHLFSLYDIVRIDHFRGLVQYWEIPAGRPTAVDGVWMEVPTYDFFDTLQDAFTNFNVICEDLGIITDDVKEAIQRYNFPGMKVLQFAFGDDNSNNPYLPVNYNDNCIVYTGTHDNMPTLGWLQSGATAQELQWIQNYSGFVSDNPVEIVWKLIELALESRASVAIIPLQDILTLGLESRINDPSKLHGNWQWRWDGKTIPDADGFSRLYSIVKSTSRLNCT